jgi:Putative auto-transporter adhesin, head GIN domain
MFNHRSAPGAHGTGLVVALAVTLAVCLAACGRFTTASGTPTSQARSVAGFTRITVTGATEVSVKVGGRQQVEVTADSNQIGDVTTTVTSGTLVIGSDSHFLGDSKATITVPQLQGATVEGSGSVHVADLSNDAFSTSISGSGDVSATGSTESLAVRVSGSGTARLDTLTAKDVTVDVTGSGDATVYSSSSLDAKVSGSGSVIYSGNPASVNKAVSGSGEVRPT